MPDVHDEVAELLGAYALHAVDDSERVLVDRHLSQCAECRSELRGFAEVTASLALSDTAEQSSSWPDIVAKLDSRSPVSLGYRWLGLAAAVSLIALSIVVVVQRVHINNLDANLALQVEGPSFVAVDEQSLLQQAASTVLAEPNGRLLSLGAEDTASQVTIVLSSDGAGYVADHNLPPLDNGRTYQLWAVVGEQVVSVGVLGSAPDVVAFHVDPVGLAGFAVTAEVPGGVVSSQNPAVVTWLATPVESS